MWGFCSIYFGIPRGGRDDYEKSQLREPLLSEKIIRDLWQFHMQAIGNPLQQLVVYCYYQSQLGPLVAYLLNQWFSHTWERSKGSGPQLPESLTIASDASGSNSIKCPKGSKVENLTFFRWTLLPAVSIGFFSMLLIWSEIILSIAFSMHCTVSTLGPLGSLE